MPRPAPKFEPVDDLTPEERLCRDGVYDLEGVAERSGVTIDVVRDLIRQKKLEAFRINTKVVVAKWELVRFLGALLRAERDRNTGGGS